VEFGILIFGHAEILWGSLTFSQNYFWSLEIQMYEHLSTARA